MPEPGDHSYDPLATPPWLDDRPAGYTKRLRPIPLPPVHGKQANRGVEIIRECMNQAIMPQILRLLHDQGGPALERFAQRYLDYEVEVRSKHYRVSVVLWRGQRVSVDIARYDLPDCPDYGYSQARWLLARVTVSLEDLRTMAMRCIEKE